MKFPVYHTPEEIADGLKVTLRTVYQWLQTGQLKGVKAGKYWRVAEPEIDAFLKEPRGRGGRPKKQKAETATPDTSDPSQTTIYDVEGVAQPGPAPLKPMAAKPGGKKSNRRR